MKHTPGPWNVHHHAHLQNEQWLSVLHGAWDITHNYADRPEVVADAKYSAMTDEENLANAHLIAAAPDMLEALENLIKANWPDAIDEAFEQAKSAISKAKGVE